MPYVYSMRDEKNNRCYPSRRCKDKESWKEKKKNTRREEREKKVTAKNTTTISHSSKCTLNLKRSVTSEGIKKNTEERKESTHARTHSVCKRLGAERAVAVVEAPVAGARVHGVPRRVARNVGAQRWLHALRKNRGSSHRNQRKREHTLDHNLWRHGCL